MHLKLKISLFLLISISLIIALYNFYNFQINIFGDRDLIRSENIFNAFEVYGYEFGWQFGRRIPGGFYYYYLGFIDLIFKNIFIKNFILSFLSILSFIVLFKINKKIFNNTDFLFSLFFFLSSTCFLQQSKLFWNPSFGLSFSILGIAFFINYFENNKTKSLFLSFFFIFLASQFHISYLSLALIFLFTSIIFKKKIFVSLPIIFFSFIICYSPYLINFIYPLVDVGNNSYEIIQNSSSVFKKDFNIFIWFIKSQFYKIDFLLTIFSNKFYLSKLIFILLLTILSAIILILFTKLIKKKTKIFQYILNKNIAILIALTFIIFITLINPSNIIFILPILYLYFFILISLIKNKFRTIPNFENKFYLIACFYIFIFFFVNLGYFMTYGVLGNIAIGSSRFSLTILPVYAILSGVCLSIILREKFMLVKNKMYKIHMILIIGILFSQIFNSISFVLKQKKIDEIYSFKSQKEIVDYLNALYQLNDQSFLNNVGFLVASNNGINPMGTIGLNYYIKNQFDKIKYKKFENCIAVVFLENNIKNIEQELEKFINLYRESVDVKKITNFKDHYIFEYKDRNNLCINNLGNDYILNSDEKKIENFLINKDIKKSYKIVENNLIQYYFNLSNKSFIWPINTLLKIHTSKNNLNLELISKVLRNSSSQLNGYWAEVNFHEPKIIFLNLEDNKKYNFQISKKMIGNDVYKSPINLSNIIIPKGKYKIILEVQKIKSLVTKNEINNVQLVLDKNFDFNY